MCSNFCILVNLHNCFQLSVNIGEEKKPLRNIINEYIERRLNELNESKKKEKENIFKVSGHGGL